MIPGGFETPLNLNPLARVSMREPGTRAVGLHHADHPETKRLVSEILIYVINMS